MKQRHKQKLVILSVVLFILFNAPVLLLFNKNVQLFGFPLIYVYIFGLWFTSSIVSLYILKKFDE